MDYALGFQSRFLKAADLRGHEPSLTITSVILEELEGKKGVEQRWIVSFDGKKKKWVLNRTNAECLKSMFGRDTDGWVGKRVTLCTGEHDGEPCLRVRGSPDIAKTFTFMLQLPRKTPRNVTMTKTGAKQDAESKAIDDGDGEPPAGVPLPTMNGTMTTT